MDAVEKYAIAVFLFSRDVFGDAAIGEEHPFFDELHRLDADFAHDAERGAVSVEHEFHFILIEFERAFGVANFLQFLAERVQDFQFFQIWSVLLIEHLLRFFIGEAFDAVDDRASEPFVLYIAVLVDHEYCAHRETIDIRLERAEIVGKRLRQHGNRPVDEIDGSSPRECFAVELGADLDIMRNVGDVDADLEISIWQFLH